MRSHAPRSGAHPTWFGWRPDAPTATSRRRRSSAGSSPVGSAADVAAAGTAYAARLWAAQRFRPEMLERLAWHRAEGHRIVVVSASLDSYLGPLAPKLGVDHVISCSLAAEDGVLTGRLVGGNVRGAEKVRRLEAWLAGTPAELWAYGDSAGDDELLAFADHPTRVER